jgi:hypothetical protein
MLGLAIIAEKAWKAAQVRDRANNAGTVEAAPLPKRRLAGLLMRCLRCQFHHRDPDHVACSAYHNKDVREQTRDAIDRNRSACAHRPQAAPT